MTESSAEELFLEMVRNTTTADDAELEEARRLAEESVAENHTQNEHAHD